ncbi:hypothetical protein [Streptomyces sp. DH24]|uniref:hypothetical protein n=1 Tax=Streptomyces sp. DH24 TaxID=3040123 RepID=UPI00244357F9|nr:hypothetical protein [Streptomyces sp. DH24]MDG9716770.1 hypothetical protein [Streptomyces sp. DH24]
MKSLKAAAVVAGSLALAGAAAPAFANQATDLTPTSLNGGVETVLAKAPGDLMPLQSQSRALDTENKDSVLHTVKGVTKTLNSNGGLLGGLPLQR